MALSVDKLHRYIVANYLSDFSTSYMHNVLTPLTNALEHTLVPQSVKLIHLLASELADRVRGSSKEDFVFDTSELPILKRALLFQRKLIHERQEGFRSKTPSEMIHRQINDMTSVVDGLLFDEEMEGVEPTRIPVLTDYLTISATYQVMDDKRLAPPKPTFDEKFGILQAPGTFFDGLRHYRHEGELRNCGVTVAYLDIDDFKRFNTLYTEPVVDSLVLPRIMQTLEAHVYAHGYAYRFGGDEYTILLPNMSPTAVVRFLEELQQKLEVLTIPNISEKATVSIGLVSVPAQSVATDLEIFEAANRAKTFAKTHGGKNCIAAYRSDSLREKDLAIVTGGKDEQTKTAQPA